MNPLIMSLYDLKSNWDGYGAIPPYPEIIQRVSQLDKSYPGCTDIYPNYQGTITLEYQKDYKLSIELGLTGYSLFTTELTPLLYNGDYDDIRPFIDAYNKLIKK